jgi:predicted deacetylase
MGEAYKIVITKELVEELRDAGAQVRLHAYKDVAPPVMPERQKFGKSKFNKK